VSAPARRRLGPDEPELLVLRDAAEVSLVAAERIAASLAAAVAARGRADWATTGGSTPAGIYRHLAREPLRDTVPWERVHIWLGDERFVPRGDEWCNARIGDRDLVAAGAGTPLERVHLHAWPVDDALARGNDAEWCAAEYAAELRREGLTEAEGVPVFDIVLVGIGPDGHLLSVFPGSTAFDAQSWTMRIPAPTHIGPMVERLTMHPRILQVGRHVMAVAHGAGKATILGEIFGPLRDPRRLPAQLARRPGALWIMDEPAASGLSGTGRRRAGSGGHRDEAGRRRPATASPPGHRVGR
jgi:6-phosphogluconolactonase